MKLITKIIAFFIVKYSVFYLFMMIKSNNYKIPNIAKSRISEDAFYYLLLYIPLPLISIILFTAPLYYSLKSKSMSIFAAVFALYLIIEYFIYTYLTSQSHIDENGVLNLIIGIIIFGIMFYKHFKQINQ
ncbi:hypothetical protein SAMN04488508_1281 [Aquimarina spongiae]|uniref:Uncharacterized protein n=1 Tax=Aquimarina spongiae TaxID=570521 RepID=A0A1M6LPI9_9FLAO|nr:hypothetical protein SAMN04488508_1281 [Aquimarina spongiae]